MERAGLVESRTSCDEAPPIPRSRDTAPAHEKPLSRTEAIIQVGALPVAIFIAACCLAMIAKVVS